MIHILDASKSVGVINSLFSKDKVEFCNEMDLDYQKIKKNYLQRKTQKNFISLEEARANKLKQIGKSITFLFRISLVSKFLKQKIEEIIDYIDLDSILLHLGNEAKIPTDFRR